ncbi:hypothetical protein Tco_0766858 [Tanacetum coccineum]
MTAGEELLRGVAARMNKLTSVDSFTSNTSFGESILTTTMNPSIASINPSAGAVGNVLGEAGSNMDTTNATNGNGDASVMTSDPYTSSIHTQVDGVADLFGVSIKTLVDIDNFTKDLESGKYTMCMPKGAPISSDLVTSDFLDASIVQSIIVHDKPNTYASAAGGSKSEPNKSKANFHSLFPENLCEGATFSIPRNVVETVSIRFANTLYGYFLGKRIAFPVVEYYARNNWGKYGLTRIMMNSKGFFFFKFKTSKGLDDVFSEDVLSIIASQIGKPIMLDSYTTSMCIESWGRSSFARCLIEINAEDALKESLTMGVPLIQGTRFTIETITIEYERKPPRCDLCKIFGHVQDHFLKKVSNTPTVVTSNVVTPC